MGKIEKEVLAKIISAEVSLGGLGAPFLHL